MKRFIILALAGTVFFSLTAREARAWIYVGATPPNIGAGSYYAGAVTQATVNQAVAAGMQNLYLTQLWKFQNQPRLAKGFANAAAYSVHAATQRGYQGYDKFAITIGTMAGAQLPSLDYDYYRDIPKKLKYKGDLYAGAALNPLAVQIGIKVTDFFYLAPKFGMLNYSYYGYAVKGITGGLMMNFQLAKKKKAGYQVFVWRGFSLGTGLLYERYIVAMNQGLGKMTNDVPGSSGLLKYVIDPKFKMTLKNQAIVLPVELSTSFRLLWIVNLSLGGGIDFVRSSAEIKVKGYSPAYLMDLGGQVPGSAGMVYAYGRQGGRMGNWFFPKLTAGVGLSFGPVVIDIPVTYYFVKGLGVGLSVGFEW